MSYELRINKKTNQGCVGINLRVCPTLPQTRICRDVACYVSTSWKGKTCFVPTYTQTRIYGRIYGDVACYVSTATNTLYIRNGKKTIVNK